MLPEPTKEDGTYEIKDPSGDRVFDYNICSNAAVLSDGFGSEQLSGQILFKRVWSYGAGGSVLGQLHADI